MSKENDLRGPGYLVEHIKLPNIKGRTYHSKGLINGKIPVYIDGYPTMLCSPASIKVIGFVD